MHPYQVVNNTPRHYVGRGKTKKALKTHTMINMQLLFASCYPSLFFFWSGGLFCYCFAHLCLVGSGRAGRLGAVTVGLGGVVAVDDDEVLGTVVVLA